MNNKPVIVHIIDTLARGGAETLLVDLLNELSEHYTIVLVNLKGDTEFELSEVNCAYRYVLGYNYNIKFPVALARLKRIIRKHKPVLVRSQLYWSTVFARLACPKHIPLIFSLHVTQSQESFKRSAKGALLRFIERQTYRPRHTAIGVTKEVLDDYNKIIGLRGPSHVLYNYVNDKYFQNAIEYKFPTNGKIRMVAVGNLKPQKNYGVLLKAFEQVNKQDINCDIYGNGPLKDILQGEIDQHQLQVHLQGKSYKVYELLKDYDAFIMCSTYEGFGISVAEAMATGIPLLLSDIQVLREISHGNAVFFDPKNPADIADKINAFSRGEFNAKEMSVKGKEICIQNYSRKAYIQRLLKIYGDVLDQKQ